MLSDSTHGDEDKNRAVANLPLSSLAVTALERAQQFADASTEGIVFYKDGRILDCNHTLADMLGRDHGALLGMDILDLFPAKDRDLASRHIYLGRSAPYLANLVHADGRFLNVEISGSTRILRGQQVWVAAVRDTSKTNNEAEQLIRSQARYRALVEKTDQAIIFTQGQSVVYANPAAQQFFKSTMQDLQGLPSIFMIHPQDRLVALQRRKEMLAGDTQEPYIVRMISPPSDQLMQDSVVSWAKLFGHEMEWEGKAAALIFISDMTRQRETQEQMRRALEQEKELGELKTRFVSMASHEFRTPLATIQTSSELLEHYSDRLTPEQRHEAIADIQASVQRIGAMMDNFLSFGRVGSGSQVCKPQPLMLLEILQSMVQGVIAADGHQHMVDLSAGHGVDASTCLMLDEVLLRQIVGNLLTNACKYSSFGQSVKLDTYLQVQDSGLAQLCISVADSGIGIPQEDLPRLFDTFHRAANAGTVQGTGLGLAIVKRALDAHGGRIDVMSQLEQGSCFTARLPWQPVSTV